MGIHLCCMTLDHADHPDWDWIRMAGDREFVSLMSKLPHERQGTENEYVRPTDFSEWRSAIEHANLPNKGRHSGLLDLLEADPNYWIYVSY